VCLRYFLSTNFLTGFLKRIKDIVFFFLPLRGKRPFHSLSYIVYLVSKEGWIPDFIKVCFSPIIPLSPFITLGLCSSETFLAQKAGQGLLSKKNLKVHSAKPIIDTFNFLIIFLVL
jgi:hypothetical protein